MEFYWLDILFWILIGASVLLSLYGHWKKSWKALLISGGVILLPILYFRGTENWFELVTIVSLITFAVAFQAKKPVTKV